VADRLRAVFVITLMARRVRTLSARSQIISMDGRCIYGLTRFPNPFSRFRFWTGFSYLVEGRSLLLTVYQSGSLRIFGMRS